jgi:hypothetical protein
MLYRTINACRLCGGGRLEDVISLGPQHLASIFVSTAEDHPLSKAKVPLTAALCGDCGLLQLRETVDREALFSEYFYRSSTNPMMAAALKDIADDVMRHGTLGRGDCIVDIGCNDGTLLSFFPEHLVRVGVEPAKNINWSGLDPSIRIINDYFAKSKVIEAAQGGPCKVVTSVAMLYSVEDVNGFASQVKSILAPDGIWCAQVSYLPMTLSRMSFYDICHEHLYYFTLDTLNRLMERNGLTIFDVATNDVNGGSLRVYAAHKETLRPKTDDFYRLLERERDQKLGDAAVYRSFFETVQKLKTSVRSYLESEIRKGNVVIGLGASTKGNVLLQFFDIDRKMMPYISERNPEKVSLETLGSGIKLISEEQARALRPSCMLVLIWFFKDEILQRERGYLDRGGKLIFPMPYPHIVSKSGEMRL